MGDRITVQFKKDEYLSPCFYSHWDGPVVLHAVKVFLEVLDREYPVKNETMPINRREPDVVLTAFLKFYFDSFAGIPESGIIDSNYRIYPPDQHEDFDNGHHVIDLDEGLTRFQKAVIDSIETEVQ